MASPSPRRRQAATAAPKRAPRSAKTPRAVVLAAPALAPTSIGDQLVSAWLTNHRINLYLIDKIPDAGLRATLSTRGGRDVAGQFVHLHNVRIWYLDRRARKLRENLQFIDPEKPPTRAQLKAAMTASAEAIATYFRGFAAAEAGIRGMKRGPLQVLAYLIAHESHHRGNILLTLKQTGNNLDMATRYKIWSWDSL